MAVKTVAELKAYFANDQVPEEDQFWDLIDSYFSKAQEALDAAATAVATANAAAATAPKVNVHLKKTAGVWSIVSGTGISAFVEVNNPTYGRILRITFTTPFADEYYAKMTTGAAVVIANPDNLSVGNGWANNVVIPNNVIISLVVF